MLGIVRAVPMRALSRAAGGELSEQVRQLGPESRAGRDVVRRAPQRMLGHRTGATHVLHAAVELVDVRLQHTVPPGHVALEQVGDLVETHSRCLAATGMRDDLPALPGLAELWGVRAFNCPFCDGHEFAGRTVGVLGAERAEHVARMLLPIGASIIVFDDGALDDGRRAALESLGAVVHGAPVTSVAPEGNGVRVAAGADIRVDGLFVTNATMRQRAPFADQLGLRMLPSGAVEIDELGRTSLAGVSAAGDLAHRASAPGVMARHARSRRGAARRHRDRAGARDGVSGVQVRIA